MHWGGHADVFPPAGRPSQNFCEQFAVVIPRERYGDAYFLTGRIVSVAYMRRKARAEVTLAENGQVARHLGQRQLVA